MKKDAFCPDHKNLNGNVAEIRSDIKEVLRTLRGSNGDSGLVGKTDLIEAKLDFHLDEHRALKTKVIYPAIVGFVLLLISTLILWAKK